MKINLIVSIPFSGYKKGDRITDEAEVKKILASENATNVLRVPGADAPKTKAESTKTGG